MDEIFYEQTQQYTAETGLPPTTAECYRMIDDLEEDMDWDFEGDNE